MGKPKRTSAGKKSRLQVDKKGKINTKVEVREAGKRSPTGVACHFAGVSARRSTGDGVSLALYTPCRVVIPALSVCPVRRASRTMLGRAGGRRTYRAPNLRHRKR